MLLEEAINRAVHSSQSLSEALRKIRELVTPDHILELEQLAEDKYMVRSFIVKAHTRKRPRRQRKFHLIKHKTKNLYWSNKTGWGAKPVATRFYTTSRRKIPIEGKWV